MNKLNSTIIEETLKKARGSDRKRAIFCFHKPDDILQRMINAGLKDTYVRPHKHENKLEIFYIIKGKAAILLFNDNGDIEESIILDENTKVVEIPAKRWHSFIILFDSAVLYELIEGKYDASTHKVFADWAPKEESFEAKDYLEKLKDKIFNLHKVS